MADTVAITLGARGCNVAIARTDHTGRIFAHDVIHDGVKVARSIDLPDEGENAGAQILLEAANKQVQDVGDGTTAVMILAQAIVNECFHMIASGVNPMSIRGELELGLTKLTTRLKKISIPVKTFSQSQAVAIISAEDPMLGKLIAEVIEKIGVEGIIEVSDSKNAETTVSYQTGMQLPRGWVHEYFVTDPERMEATLERPYILVTDMPIMNLQPFEKLLLGMAAGNKKLLIIAPSIEGEALTMLLKNKIEGKLSSLAIKVPSFGQPSRNAMEDIAILTGGRFINEGAADAFEDVVIDDLGRCDYVLATKTDSTIVGGHGKRIHIHERVKSLKAQIKDESDDFAKQKLRERLAKLTNGVAVIYVGGQTEVEMKERRERVDDAVHATQAALREGIVPGGEIVYKQISDVLGDTTGERVLYHALKKPFEKLLENAGIDIVEATTRLVGAPESVGIDVTTGEAVDMMTFGIIDPVAVPLNALANSVSVAVQLMSTKALIIPDIPKK